MTLARSPRATLAELEQHTRVLLEDPLTTPAGDPRTILEWQSWQVFEALNAAYRELQTDLVIDHQAEFLEPVTLNYVENAARTGMALPADLRYELIAAVEDVTDTASRARVLRYVPPSMILAHDVTREDSSVYSGALAQVYTLVSDAAIPQIILRPQPLDGGTFRVWVQRAPLIADAPGDLHPLSARWKDLICLMAAFNLRGLNGDFPPEMAVRMAKYQDQFARAARLNQAPLRVTNRRIGR